MEAHTGQYEFTASQNATMGRAARWSSLLSWILMGSAAVLALAAILSGEAASIGSLIVAAVYFVIGLNFRGAARAMGHVVETTGNDIDHLMTALDELGSALKTMSILFLVGVVVFAVAVVVLTRWMASVPS
jgi:uncharacterized membrane protein